jgi:hypothetical protein
MKSRIISRLLFLSFLVPAISCVQAQTVASAKSDNQSVNVSPGTALVAELTKSINAKKAKMGDTVKTKIVQDVIANGRIVIPRGSKLIGHISKIKMDSQDEPKSVLGLAFDRVVLGAGEEMSLNAALVAVAPAVQGADPLSASTSSYGGTGGFQPSGRTAPGMAADPRINLDRSRTDALTKATDPRTYGVAATNAPRSGFLGAGNRGVLGMPGISLKVISAASTELVSSKADIKLENGTQLVLEVR